MQYWRIIWTFVCQKRVWACNIREHSRVLCFKKSVLGFCVSQESVDMQYLKRFMTFVCERECVREGVCVRGSVCERECV